MTFWLFLNLSAWWVLFCGKVRVMMHHEFGRIWKEVVVAFINKLYQHLPELRKTMKSLNQNS